MNRKKITLFIGQHTHPRAYSGFRKQLPSKIMIIFFLGLVPFIHACENPKSIKEREPMGMMTKTNSKPEVMKPLIDAFAPVETETATFAMG